MYYTHFYTFPTLLPFTHYIEDTFLYDYKREMVTQLNTTCFPTEK